MLCPRLVKFREQNQINYPQFYNGAVPSFGELNARLLVVGLAPGLKGANATGRPFTGDFAGEVLYPALLRSGFATGTYSGLESRGDAGTTEKAGDLKLLDVRISNAVRCVPPENKPTPQEMNTCNQFLKNEIAAMPQLKLILTLGLVSHNAVLKALNKKISGYKFAHGAIHKVSGIGILNSYHTSRYNLNTGRLTEVMFEAVIRQAREMLL